MTKYHRRIIKYMELKAERAGDSFLAVQDIRSIQKWPDVIAEYIWRSLEDHIKMLNKSGISPWTCPFCIKYFYNECRGCEWGKHHGECQYKRSDVHKIKNKNKFTNNFYRMILKEAKIN